MKRNILKYMALIGLAAGLFSCEKDENKVVMLESPIAPSITTMPNLTLQRANGTNILEFVATPVNPGFEASANYTLEACKAGTAFADAAVIYSGVKAESIKISVSDLNGILLKKFPADQVSSVDFRLRAVLVVDAGTGAPGTSANPFQYISETKNASVTLYGLPRLDLKNSGVTQKIESPLGDGKYAGFVKLDATKPFTLVNPDTNVEYGVTGGKLVANGSGIAVAESGWYKFAADVNAQSYSASAYMIGLVGSATPNAWNSPDQKMDYDAATGTWKITLDLVDGEIKFRKNDGWAWNLGGTADALTQGGANIAVTAGNYTITLTIVNDATGSCTIVKN